MIWFWLIFWFVLYVACAIAMAWATRPAGPADEWFDTLEQWVTDDETAKSDEYIRQTFGDKSWAALMFFLWWAFLCLLVGLSEIMLAYVGIIVLGRWCGAAWMWIMARVGAFTFPGGIRDKRLYDNQKHP